MIGGDAGHTPAAACETLRASEGGGRPRHPGGRSAVNGLFISTHDHDPLDDLADHGQRQRSLPGLALTERDYSINLNVGKLFRSPIISAGQADRPGRCDARRSSIAVPPQLSDSR